MKIKTFHINLHVNCFLFHFFLISYDDVGGVYTNFLPEHNTGIDVWGNELSGNDQPHTLLQHILSPAPHSPKNTRSRAREKLMDEIKLRCQFTYARLVMFADVKGLHFNKLVLE